MPYAFCGEGDDWLQIRRTEEGSRLRVCNPCWEARARDLMIVPEDGVVIARCQRCGGYFNPREMAQVSPGGRYNAYSGTCETCTKECARNEKIAFTQLG